MPKLILGILVVFTAACGGQQTPNAPSNRPAGFSGRVLDFTTNLALSAVTVSFGDKTAITGADGTYVLNVPSGQYEPTVDGVRVGTTHVTGGSYRGDFLVHTGTCVSRYGTVSDRQTLKPVAGAAVGFNGSSAAITTTGTDGWYRIDLGCPTNGIVGFNTTFLVVSHPNHASASQTVGRGIYGVTRMDVELDRK